jgi:hypothetical protein
MIKIDNTTYKVENLGNEDESIIIIGGSDKSKFAPNINFSFSFGKGEEYFINLNRKDKVITTETPSFIDGVLKIKKDDTDKYYHVNNVFKWDIEFDSKPKSNIIEFDLKCSPEINFYYQASLVDQYNADHHGCSTLDEYLTGHYRPDNVIGSYAVFCDKVHNEYKTGKLCHIYRPLCKDASGKTVWAELLIKNKKLIITIPQKFLDDAVYPVTLDPDIGKTTVGATRKSNQYNTVTKVNTTISSDGLSLSSLHCYTDNGSASPVTYHIGIYNDNAGAPGTLFIKQTPIAAGSQSAQWIVYARLSGAFTNGVKYYPAMYCATNVYGYYDTTTSGNTLYRYNSAGLVDNPTGYANDNFYFSLYYSTAQTYNITGSIPSVSNTIGTPSIIKDTTGNIPSVSNTTGTASAAIIYNVSPGAMPSVSNVIGNIVDYIIYNVSGLIESISNVLGTPSIIKNSTGNCPSISNVEGFPSIAIINNVSGNIPSVSDVIGNPLTTIIYNIIGLIPSVSDVIGTVSAIYIKNVSGSIPSISNAWGTAGFIYNDKDIHFNFKKYKYRIKSFNGDNTSEWVYSRLVSGKLTAPGSFSALAIFSSQINLSWSAPVYTVDDYYLEYSFDGIFFIALATLPSGTTVYSHTGLDAGTVYCYRLRAKSDIDYSEWTITSAETYIIIVDPTNFIITTVSSSQLNLTWDDTTGDEDGFYIEYSLDGVTYTPLVQIIL